MITPEELAAMRSYAEWAHAIFMDESRTNLANNCLTLIDEVERLNKVIAFISG